MWCPFTRAVCSTWERLPFPPSPPFQGSPGSTPVPTPLRTLARPTTPVALQNELFPPLCDHSTFLIFLFEHLSQSDLCYTLVFPTLGSEILKGRDLDLIHPVIPLASPSWPNLESPGSQGSERGLIMVFKLFLCFQKIGAQRKYITLRTYKMLSYLHKLFSTLKVSGLLSLFFTNEEIVRFR